MNDDLKIRDLHFDNVFDLDISKISLYSSETIVSALNDIDTRLDDLPFIEENKYKIIEALRQIILRFGGTIYDVDPYGVVIIQHEQQQITSILESKPLARHHIDNDFFVPKPSYIDAVNDLDNRLADVNYDLPIDDKNNADIVNQILAKFGAEEEEDSDILH